MSVHNEEVAKLAADVEPALTAAYQALVVLETPEPSDTNRTLVALRIALAKVRSRMA